MVHSQCMEQGPGMYVVCVVHMSHSQCMEQGPGMYVVCVVHMSHSQCVEQGPGMYVVCVVHMSHSQCMEQGPGICRTMKDNRSPPLSWFRCNVKTSTKFHAVPVSAQLHIV